MKKNGSNIGGGDVRYVAYMRVSTSDQEAGIEVQRQALLDYGPVGFYVDRFSGKGDSRRREGLESALSRCRDEGCVLLFYKVDRLSRDVESLFRIANSGIRLYCHTQPELNTILLGVLASVAQHEREEISRRTKEGLAVKRSQGVVLGMPSHRVGSPSAQEIGRKGGLVSGARSSRAAIKRNVQTMNLCYDMVVRRGMTLRAAADQLNELGFETPRGKRFQSGTVYRMLLKRVEAGDDVVRGGV
jgi:DNA invertase Pin-like site-specific DNA recombinase